MRNKRQKMTIFFRYFVQIFIINTQLQNFIFFKRKHDKRFDRINEMTSSFFR